MRERLLLERLAGPERMLKVIGNPEEALALRLKGASP